MDSLRTKAGLAAKARLEPIDFRGRSQTVAKHFERFRTISNNFEQFQKFNPHSSITLFNLISEQLEETNEKWIGN